MNRDVGEARGGPWAHLGADNVAAGAGGLKGRPARCAPGWTRGPGGRGRASGREAGGSGVTAGRCGRREHGQVCRCAMEAGLDRSRGRDVGHIRANTKAEPTGFIEPAG